MFKNIPILIIATIILMSCNTSVNTNKEIEKEESKSKIFKSPITQIGWIGVKSEKLEKANTFFSQILELDKYTSIPKLDIELYQLPSGQFFELMSNKTPQADLFIKPFIGFEVSNIDIGRTVLEKQGLKFVSETYKIPDGGWAFFKDNEGNLMEIVQNPKLKKFNQTEKKLKITGIGWVGIDVNNHKESFKFFNQKLGLQYVPLPGENNPYSLMGFKNKTYFEVLDHLEEETGVKYPIIAFQVQDILKSVEILKERKVKLIGKIGGNPGLSVQKFEGPDGILYQLAEITPPK